MNRASSIVEFHLPASRQEDPAAEKIESLPSVPPALPSVVIGRLIGFENGQALVDFPGHRKVGGIVAQTGIPLSPAKLGREVILAFADGDPDKPVILSLLVNVEAGAVAPSPLDIQVDGERLLVTAQSEIVLRCGEASITLTKAGKVLINGSYVLSRSTGYNKIKGAAIDIN